MALTDAKTSTVITLGSTLSYAIIFALVRRVGPWRAKSTGAAAAEGGAAEPSSTTSSEVQQLDLATRAVSFVNIGVCMVACAQLALDPHSYEAVVDLEQAAFNSSPTRDFFLLVVSGYMIYDAVVLVAYARLIGDPLMLVHHAVVVIGLQVGVRFQAATFYISVLFVNEFSTIFLNIRYILLYAGRSHEAVYVTNGLALLVSFFLCRMCMITALVVHAAYAWWVLAFVRGLYWTRPVSDRFLFGGLTLLLVVHYVLNIFWFLKIVAHARRGLRRSMSKEKVR